MEKRDYQKILNFLSLTDAEFDKLFGCVHIGRLIASGSYAQVYELQSEKNFSHLAIKFCDVMDFVDKLYNGRADLLQESEQYQPLIDKYVADLTQEQAIGKALSCDGCNHILPVLWASKFSIKDLPKNLLFSARDNGDIFILVMPYCHTLNEYVDSRATGALEELRALNIISQLATGLSVLHTPMQNRNIILHRDIKPNNLFFYSNGYETYPVIGDFGCSKIASSNLEPDIIPFNYHSPFKHPSLLETRTETPATDIYALGMVMLYMLISNGEAEAFKTRLGDRSLKSPKYFYLMNLRAHINDEYFDCFKPSAVSSEAWEIISKAVGHNSGAYGSGLDACHYIGAKKFADDAESLYKGKLSISSRSYGSGCIENTQYEYSKLPFAPVTNFMTASDFSFRKIYTRSSFDEISTLSPGGDTIAPSHKPDQQSNICDTFFPFDEISTLSPDGDTIAPPHKQERQSNTCDTLRTLNAFETTKGLLPPKTE